MAIRNPVETSRNPASGVRVIKTPLPTHFRHSTFPETVDNRHRHIYAPPPRPATSMHSCALLVSDVRPDAASAPKWIHEVVPDGWTWEAYTEGGDDTAHAILFLGRSWEDSASVFKARAVHPSAFIIFCHPAAVEDPAGRWSAFARGANMVTSFRSEVKEALRRVSGIAKVAGAGLTCPWCGSTGLAKPKDLYLHFSMYHINALDLKGPCPACEADTKVGLHLHTDHSGVKQPGRRGVYALLVVRRPSDGKFLMCQERFGTGFWLPGGGLDPGESLQAGALRECREEAGVDVVLKGVLCVESAPGGDWRRAIFYGEPHIAPFVELLEDYEHDCHEIEVASGHEDLACSLDPPSCKTVPDYESAGACWVTTEDLARIPLRCASEPCKWIPYVAQEGDVRPLEMPQEWSQVFTDVQF
eukprot:gene1316-32669_t